VRDGRPQFFKNLDVDKQTMKLLYAFRDLKIQMLNEKDGDYYSPGKRYTEKE
jgi:hypothetical protein